MLIYFWVKAMGSLIYFWGCQGTGILGKIQDLRGSRDLRGRAKISGEEPRSAFAMNSPDQSRSAVEETTGLLINLLFGPNFDRSKIMWQFIFCWIARVGSFS